MKDHIKRALMRFARGAVAGAIAAMIPLLPQTLSDVGNVKNWLMSLGVAGFIGATAGLILAVDKMLRDSKEKK